MNGKKFKADSMKSLHRVPEQSIRILAQAIQQKFSSQEAKKINTENTKILKILENENALPPGMNLKESEEIS